MAIKLSSLMNAVCTIRIFDGKEYYQGQGVFLKPDIVLTARHCVVGKKKVEVVHDNGTAELLKRSPFNKASDNLDLAIMQISRPLAAHTAELDGCDERMLDMKGWLVTRFTGKATYHQAGIDLSRASFDLQRQNRRSFALWHESHPGYSGSPIFDSAGRLASILLGKDTITMGGRNLLPGEGLHSAYGPPPPALNHFIRSHLSPGR